MTAFDYALLVVLALSAAVGMWRGLVSEIMSLVAWITALFLAWRYAKMAARLFTTLIEEEIWRNVAGFVLIFLVVVILAAVVRWLMRELLRVAGLRPTDRFFGALFGLVRGFAIAFVAVLLGGLIGVGEEPWWANARFSRPLETAVIAAKPWLPEMVAKNIRYR